MIKLLRSRLLLLVAVCGALPSLASCSSRKTAVPVASIAPNSSQKFVQPYGQRVRFEKGKPLQFEGQTHVKVKRYPNGFICENFTVTVGGKSQKITWSLGTGLLAPTNFSVAGQIYLLELKSSDILGKLDEDHLIVWHQKEWQRKQAELHPTAR